MANILDATSAVPAKVSAAGALHTVLGDDGYPTYLTRFGGLRITTAYLAATYAWAMRAPVGKTVNIRNGRLRLAFDGTVGAGTAGLVEFVRFSVADPAGGQLLTPTRKSTAEAAASTVAIREGTATLGPTLAGATIDASAASIGGLAIPYSATGVDVELSLESWAGLLLLPGEGLALRCVSALAIGTQLGGYLEFSEQ